MKTRFLATTALALGLLLPAGAMAQQSSGDSPAKPTMKQDQTTPGTSSSGTSNSDTTGTSGTTGSSTMSSGSSGTTGSSTMSSGTSTSMSTIDKSVVGKSLYGANDEEVGEIDDVVMSSSGGVESVLVDVGGFLGLGAKTIAVPVDNIQMQGDKLVDSSLTKEQAEQMPEYKK